MPRDAVSRTANVHSQKQISDSRQCGSVRGFSAVGHFAVKKMLVSVRLGQIRLGFFLRRTVLRRKIRAVCNILHQKATPRFRPITELVRSFN